MPLSTLFLARHFLDYSGWGWRVHWKEGSAANAFHLGHCSAKFDEP